MLLLSAFQMQMAGRLACFSTGEERRCDSVDTRVQLPDSFFSSIGTLLFRNPFIPLDLWMFILHDTLFPFFLFRTWFRLALYSSSLV